MQNNPLRAYISFIHALKNVYPKKIKNKTKGDRSRRILLAKRLTRWNTSAGEAECALRLTMSGKAEDTKAP
jgi:hypothetical protein